MHDLGTENTDTFGKHSKILLFLSNIAKCYLHLLNIVGFIALISISYVFFAVLGALFRKYNSELYFLCTSLLCFGAMFRKYRSDFCFSWISLLCLDAMFRKYSSDLYFL